MVKTGLDILLTEYIGELKGRRIGVLANRASVTRDAVGILEALFDAGLDVRAVFAPEHGFGADAPAAALVPDSTYGSERISIYSLYGQSRFPTPESLAQVDLILVDLQDVGARFYTYIHTMAHVLAACKDAAIPIWVLDRPNPISSILPEGYIPSKWGDSFFEWYPIPITHTLTIGELALLLSQVRLKCDIRIVRMRGWKHGMWFADTGLPWVRPSPNIRSLDTTLVYPGTCLIEGTNLSEGRGTDRPFELVGAPWIDRTEVLKRLESYQLPGVVFSEAEFIPETSKCQGIRCHGVQLIVSEKTTFRPVLTGVALLCAVHAVHSEFLKFPCLTKSETPFIDVLSGNDSIRYGVASEMSPWEIASGWEHDILEFNQACLDAKTKIYHE